MPENENRETTVPVVSGVEAIHEWFSLSYANYLVLPRSVLQSMPDEWQERFVACLDEMTESFGHLDWPRYDVRALARAPQLIEDEDEGYRYETADEVGVTTDPIPHYNRGRTRIEPAVGRVDDGETP